MTILFTYFAAMKKLILLISIFYISTIYAQTTNQSNWQQNVNYTIQVSLDDEKHVLNGNIEIKYTNNSPNSLEEIWFHFWPNAYKNTQTAFAKQQIENNSTEFYFSKERDKGYINGLSFMVDSTPAVLTYHPQWIDVAKLSLPKKLESGQSITISTPFIVKIPGSFSRMGHVKNSYQITQWFPKPAVYDVNGWNYFPYLDQGEFYSEFGSFDVSITVPQNYVVAATGILQDSTEKEWLKERILYYKGNSDREEQTASSAILKTLHFKQDSIHDFAWFADKDFFVYESEQMLKDSSKKVKTYLYSTSDRDADAVIYVNQGVEFYSDKVGNYPYEIASAVVGPLKAGGGMEYPMITVVADADKTTIVHEVGHNWFYGILGSNERMYPWMDESINTYYEDRQSSSKVFEGYKKNYSNKHGGKNGIGNGLGLVYMYSVVKNTEQAVNLKSTDYTSANYGGIIYGKGAFAFGLLQEYLGDSLFDASMKTYYETWKFKHPLPNDFKNSIEKSTQKDLSWFFDGLMSTTNTVDYKIKAIKFKTAAEDGFINDSNNFKILVKNKGQIAAPFQIVTLADGEKEKERWETGFTGSKWIELPGTERLRTLNDNSLFEKEAKRVNKRMSKVNEVVLNADNPLKEINLHNNRIKTTGIFKKSEKLAIGGANHLDRRTTPSLIPLVNYNFYDKWMYGGVLSNLAHWERRFHYYGAVFYSNHLNPIKYELFAAQTLRLKSKIANRMDIYGKAASFGLSNTIKSTYTRLNGGASIFIINKNKANSRALRKFDINYNQMSNSIDKNSINANQVPSNAYCGIATIEYEYKSNKKLHPFTYKITNEFISIPKPYYFAKNDFNRIYAEINKTIHFSKMNNYLKIRGFAGFIIGTTNNNLYNYRAAGNNGRMDAKFEDNLFARNEEISSRVLGARVLSNRFGALRAPALVFSTGALQAINIEYNFSRKIPFNLSFDAAYLNKSISNINLSYVGGINMVILKDYFEISLPLTYSDDIRNYMSTNFIKAGKNSIGNFNPFKDWHRTLVFKFNINFNQDDIINKIGL